MVIMALIRHLIDAAKGKHPLSSKRSSHWASVRKAHLEKNPVCAVCGGREHLEVHHKLPFHLDPSLELDPNNLITLCEAKKDGVNCHLFVGHLGNFKSYNKDVEADARNWNSKLKERPKTMANQPDTTEQPSGTSTAPAPIPVPVVPDAKPASSPIGGDLPD